MEQVRKALSRSKTAFEKIQEHRRICDHLVDEDQLIIGREIYETEKAITDLNRIKKLIKVKEEYIELLQEELVEVVSIAANHGWKSNRYLKGKELREKIQELEKINCNKTR